MDLLLVAHTLLFAISAVACLVSIPRALAIQHRGTRDGLVAFLLSVAVWSVGYVGYLLAPTEPLKLASYIIGFVFAFVAVGAWLYFCAAYTGRPPSQAPYRRSILAVFLGFTALKVTNPIHELYFTTAWTTEPFPHLGIEHAVLYWILLGLSYAAIAVGFFMLFERFYYTGADSRPLLALVAITAVPAVATIFGDRIQWLLPLMYEPPGVALFALGTLFVYSERLEAIRLTGESSDPAIYLDADGRIRDFNHAAARILPRLDGAVGKLVDDIAPELADAIDSNGVFQRKPDSTAALSKSDSKLNSKVDSKVDSKLAAPAAEASAPRYFEPTSSPFSVGEVTTGHLVTITDVTDRERYREQLEAKTEQLEALNRVVRHDIRNDMAVIIGWTELLADHIDDEGRDAFNRVLQKSHHVVRLTENARDFVESLTGDGEASLKPIDLEAVLDAELAAIRESFADAVFEVDGELPTVSVTANEMLSSVIRNLLENAVRHNDETTPAVTVHVEAPDDERIWLHIADNGPGISDERKTEVFGKGMKGIDSPGSGIGLYLVDTLTRQFGGDVWIEDAEPKGTVFVVELIRSDRTADTAFDMTTDTASDRATDTETQD